MDEGISVIVPAHNAEGTIADCLRAILNSSVYLNEIIVFDDGSSDDTLKIIQGFPVRILSNPLPLGPAHARNRCVSVAKSEILAFVDADVIVHRDAIATVVLPIIERSVVAAFGSYDDRPRSNRIVALYANLRHHFMHQNGQSDAHTFWTGLSAIRQRAFHDVGGFDPRACIASVEDIELGVRLKTAGYRIRLVPTAQGSHCKDWRLLELWQTDIFRRAMPWSRLLVSGETQGKPLNLSRAERLKTILAYVTLLSGGAGCVTGWFWVAPVGIVAFAMSNVSFLALLYRVGGLTAVAAGLPLHLCYYVYSSATFVLVAGQKLLRREVRC